MKNFCLLLLFIVALCGCAAQKFNAAAEKANLVKNGMTLDQAIDILGMPPNHGVGDYMQWRRGNAWIYTGSPTGAIEFHVVDGRIVDVPEGGIFSPAGVVQAKQRNDEMVARLNREYEERERLAAQARKEAADRVDAQRAKADEQRRNDIAAEAEAASNSTVVCRDKATCAKVFALSQIYVQEHSDQKIQVATDTIIETYNPTEDGKIGILITKRPGAGTAEAVTITPQCNNKSGLADHLCHLQRTRIYRGFRPFIERSLSM